MSSEALSDPKPQTPDWATAAKCPFHATHGAALAKVVAERAAPPDPIRVASALVDFLAAGFGRYGGTVCLAADAPEPLPADRMTVTVEAAQDGDLHLALHMPGGDALRLDMMDLGIYRLLGQGLPMPGGPVRILPLPSRSRVWSGDAALHKDVIYRIAELPEPDPEELAMGG